MTKHQKCPACKEGDILVIYERQERTGYPIRPDGYVDDRDEVGVRWSADSYTAEIVCSKQCGWEVEGDFDEFLESLTKAGQGS